MSRVLCIGTATLDIVNRVPRYPEEDSEVRATSQVMRMGGNAANTAIVLAQLGDDVAWVGHLPANAEIVDSTFARHGVDASHATRVADRFMPTSYIIASDATGSRSIVHYRDIPEYSADDFVGVDLDDSHWVHFEGRAVDQLGAMLRHVRRANRITVSLEVEKPRPGIEDLFGHADLLLFSRAYAHWRGFTDAPTFLRGLPKGARATCAWGAMGAWAIDVDGSLLHALAPVLDRVVDTVGAGDAFNAGVIHASCAGQALAQALSAGVALASLTCTQDGLAFVR